MNDAVGLVLFENAREFILNPPKFSNDVLGEAVIVIIYVVRLYKRDDMM